MGEQSCRDGPFQTEKRRSMILSTYGATCEAVLSDLIIRTYHDRAISAVRQSILFRFGDGPDGGGQIGNTAATCAVGRAGASCRPLSLPPRCRPDEACPEAAGTISHSSRPSTLVGSGNMGRHIDTDDIIDARGMAEVLGLAQRNTVSLYQRRYALMPRPVIDLGQGRCKLWLRSEVEEWHAKRSSQPDPA